ncbi:MAG TPA: hypothetical protein VGE18_00870 [Candidatus Paceibacterota bacterium]
MEEQNEQNIQRAADPVVEPVAPALTPVHKPSTGAVWLLVIVCIVVALLVLTSKAPMNSDTLSTVPGETDTQALCYYSSTQTASGFNDTYALKLVLASDSTATGELATAPAEKDSMQGTLTGSVVENGDELLFDGWYANSAEGMNNTDQRLIKLTESEARIGYGETVLNADGTYSYKDEATVNYSLAIPRVDCAVYDQTVTLRS